jgi:hypothetical protein
LYDLWSFSFNLLSSKPGFKGESFKKRYAEVFVLWTQLTAKIRGSTIDISFTFQFEVPIPTSKIQSTEEFLVVPDNEGNVKGISIRKKGTFEEFLVSTHQVSPSGSREINRLLGYLSLYSDQTIKWNGSAEGSSTNKCGKWEGFIKSEPVSKKFVAWQNHKPISLDQFKSFSKDKLVALELIYSGIIAEGQNLLRGAYLNYYLALDTLLSYQQEEDQSHKEFRYVRNGITHINLVYKETVDSQNMKGFLVEQFGISEPNWESEDTTIKLHSWVMKIRQKLREVVFS